MRGDSGPADPLGLKARKALKRLLRGHDQSRVTHPARDGTAVPAGTACGGDLGAVRTEHGDRVALGSVSLYRFGDVRALLEPPGVDWEAVRGLPKGTPSPLREYARLAPTRAAAVRGFAQGLADRHGVTVWAWHSPFYPGPRRRLA